MHWKGYCRPMDAVDFKSKSRVDHYYGWPITRDDLKDYYNLACEIVEINPFFKNYPESKTFFNNDLNIVSLPFHISPPVRFGIKYREQLGSAKNVFSHLFSNARDFITTDDTNSIDRLRVITTNNNVFLIKAKRFILCCGGIENARILLNSNRSLFDGIGNHHDLVGRYFMTHLHMPGFGKALITHLKVSEITKSLLKPNIHYLTLKEKIKQDKKLLNVGFHLHPGHRFKTPGDYPKSMQKVLPAFESLLNGNGKFQFSRSWPSPNRDRFQETGSN